MNENNIQYHKDDHITAEELSTLFQQSGIKRPSQDLPRLQKMIEHADLTFTARNNGTLVGIARSITDFHYCCYLSDLAVHKDYQHQSIGKKLVELVQLEIGKQVALILLSSPEAFDYYPKIGFDTIKNGYIIPRTE